MKVFFLCLFLLTVIVILLVLTAIYKNILGYTRPQQELITCIMITGKDASRKDLAIKSIQNFREQTYDRKHLVILNHGDYRLVENSSSMFNVTEIHVDKPIGGITLGGLRNMALEFVPYNGLFCVWDDDDYRSPMFLTKMYAEMSKHAADGIYMTNRLEYNSVTDFAWHVHLKVGGFVHVLARRQYTIKYLLKDTMEDVELINLMKNAYKVVAYDNDPTLYVRLVHETNTSIYVDKNKAGVITTDNTILQERELNAREKRFIQTYKRS